MKRLLAIVMLILCFALLMACESAELLNEMGEQIAALDNAVDGVLAAAQQAQDAQEAIEALYAPEGEEVPGEEAATATDTVVLDPNIPSDTASATDTVPAAPLPTDSPATEGPAADGADPGIEYRTLTAADCVTDAWPEDPNVMPRITVECQGAREINQLVIHEFAALAGDGEHHVHYEVYKNDRILSILMECQLEQAITCVPYNLDLATGQRITGAELLDLLGQDGSELAQLELAILGDEFTYAFGGLQSIEPERYARQYGLTTAPENANTDDIWLGDEGQLYFVGCIYDMYGPEYNDYPMGTSLYFQ